MTEKSKKHFLEFIKWKDHCSFSDAGWRSEEQLKELQPTTILSVGFVIYETPKYLLLAATASDQGNFCSDLCIIKSTIVKRWRLKSPIA